MSPGLGSQPDAEALFADGRLEIDGDIQIQRRDLAGAGFEHQKTAVGRHDGHGFLDGDIVNRLTCPGDTRLFNGLHQIHAAPIKEGRIARIHADHKVIHIQRQTEGHDMFHHAHVVVGGTTAEHDVALGRPNITGGHLDGHGVGKIGAVEPPALCGCGFQVECPLCPPKEGTRAGNRYRFADRCLKMIRFPDFGDPFLIHRLGQKTLELAVHFVRLSL